jgi:hypothetical protein
MLLLVDADPAMVVRWVQDVTPDQTNGWTLVTLRETPLFDAKASAKELNELIAYYVNEHQRLWRVSDTTWNHEPIAHLVAELTRKSALEESPLQKDFLEKVRSLTGSCRRNGSQAQWRSDSARVGQTARLRDFHLVCRPDHCTGRLGQAIQQCVHGTTGNPSLQAADTDEFGQSGG